jgi:hypothetical protein
MMAPCGPQCPDDNCERGPLKATAADPGQLRAEAARTIRIEAAEEEFDRLFGPGGTKAFIHCCNGDEDTFASQNFIASFTKGLSHDLVTGEVNPAAYQALLDALESGDEQSFRNLGTQFGCLIPGTSVLSGAQRRLENPRAGYAFDIEGADSHSLSLPCPPTFSSPEQAADMLELYWQALARDVPFIEYDASPPPVLQAAATDLSRPVFNNYWTTFAKAPAPPTPTTVFRGFTPGDQVGPYLSQFLLMDVPYGAQVIPARIRSVQPGIDYMTTWIEWRDVQNGCDANQSACDRVPRFIRSGRDLAQFVHVDLGFNAFLNACFILFGGRDPLRRCEAAPGLGAPFAEQLPYVSPTAPAIEEFPTEPIFGPNPFLKSNTEIGMATFGPFHLKSLLLEVVSRATKAVWYQKWQVHRRLRPEEFGGRVHRNRRLLDEGGTAPYPIDASLASSPLFNNASPFSVFAHNALQNANKRSLQFSTDPGETRDAARGTYLLPMAYAEGSPLHPSYAQGHATIAGACTTILKAFFFEGQKIVNPVVPNRDGTSVEPYTGPDAGQLTVGGELEKLASNIGIGRDFGGVHYRTDYVEGLLLGEKVAISLLFDQRKTYAEQYAFNFTRFDGTSITIHKNSTLANLQAWLA